METPTTPHAAHEHWVQRLLGFNHQDQPVVAISLIGSLAIAVMLENFTRADSPLPLSPHACGLRLFAEHCERFKRTELLLVLALTEHDVPLSEEETGAIEELRRVA